MSITYENHGDYYIFSHKPEVRVYLGDRNPDDYVWDELEQQKRSASCHYVEKETGEKLNPADVCMIEIDHGYEYVCDYDFTRRIQGMSSCGNLSTGRGVEYPVKDKAMRRLAESWYFNKSLEAWDAQQEEYRKEREDYARKNPWIHNLVMVWKEGIGNCTYYVDDDGNEITVKQHEENMKEQFGEDVFEMAYILNPVDPEVQKQVDRIMKAREDMKDMTEDQKLEYLKNWEKDVA